MEQHVIGYFRAVGRDRFTADTVSQTLCARTFAAMNHDLIVVSDAPLHDADGEDRDMTEEEMDAYIDQVCGDDASDGDDFEHCLTVAQARAMVEVFSSEPDGTRDMLMSSPAFMCEQTYSDPDEPGRTRTLVAGIRGGGLLYYVEQDGGAQHWLEIA